MGLAIVDYFLKSDAFDFNLRLLVFCGFWPMKSKNKRWQIIHSVYCFICLFSLTSMLFIQVLDLYLLRNDPITFAKNMCATTLTIGSIAKYFSVFYNIDQLQVLHPVLIRFIKSVTDPEDVKIAEKAYAQMRRTTKAFFSLAVPCILAWMLYPGLESSGEKRVPFPYRLPTDDWSTPVYEILYTYQSLSMVGFMIIILSNDLVFYGTVIKINAKYDMLIRRVYHLQSELVGNNNEGDDETLTGMSYDPMMTERIRAKLKECTMFHQQILDEIKQLNEIYSGQCFVHFFTAVSVVGVLVIDVVVISKGIKLQMLQRITYAANGVFDTFLLCYYATEMQEKSHKLQMAIYSMPWYRFSPELRRELLLILAKSNKPPMCTAAHFFPINLTTFLNFLKLTYNTTALLYQTIR